MPVKQTVRSFLTTAILLCTALVLSAQIVRDMPDRSFGTEDVVLRWNRVLMERVSTSGPHPATIMPVRGYAMMHAAMFDAANSIDGTYTPYMTEVPGRKNGSAKTAAARAAHDVLVGLYPTRVDIFEAELAASQDGIDTYRTQQGIRVGQIVSTRMLAARAGDGWTVVPPSYNLPTTPGIWQPVTPTNTAATSTHYPSVQPFATNAGSQFVLDAAPSMTSAEYTAAFNDVKEIGSATSVDRNSDQTQVARRWPGVYTPTNFLSVWNNVARTMAETRGSWTVETARLVAFTNIALNDALQTGFAGKFQYGQWRPVTEICRADQDGSPDTIADTTWMSPFTAPYPAYAGNMAAVGALQSAVLSLFLGRDDIRFSRTREGTRRATRAYARFSVVVNEQEKARLGPHHFTFYKVAGQSIGRNVGTYVVQTSCSRDAVCNRFPIQ